MPAYYMMASCVVGMIALRFTLVETAGQSLRGAHVPGTPEALAEQERLARA